MQSPLNESQRELLSAYFDGEVSSAEKQTAVELLQREDAREYVESLRTTAKLVTENAPVRAPVGLSGRVMTELKDEFRKSADPGSEPFAAMPRISWQAPIWAAAAAIVVSVAIMFGPSLFNSSPQGPSIARDVLENLPERSGPAEGVDEPLVQELEDANTLEFQNALPGELAAGERRFGETAKKAGAQLEKLEESKSPLDDPAEEKVQNDPDDAATDKYARRADEHEESEKGVGGGAGESGRKEASGGDTWDGGARGKSAKSKSEPGTPEPQPRRNRDDAKGGIDDSRVAPNKEADRELDDANGQPSGGVVPPAAPAEPLKDAERRDVEAPEPVELKLTEGDTLAAQNDVLWVSKLYGDASLTEGDEDVESVEVEVAADKVPELIAALRKLADDQGYGSVEGAETLTRTEAEPAEGGESPRGISGYLPVEEQRDEQALETRQQERVKLIIRMK